jgi:hypothetical protein
MLSEVWETLCADHGLQFDISDLDIPDIFENIFYTAPTQLIVYETNKYAQQKILKTFGRFILSSRIRKWENVTEDEMYVVLAMFTLMSNF